MEVCHSLLHHHHKKVLVFRTVGENAIRFNKMSREEAMDAIRYVLRTALDFQPTILNFSQPKWSEMENFLGCYSNVAIHPGMEGKAGFRNSLL